MEERYRPLDREPDVETPSFSLWKTEPGEIEDKSSLITINYDAGEEMHETRIYRAIFQVGYELLVLAKKRGDEYWFAVKGKRPSGHTFIKTSVEGPMSLKEYKRQMSRLELVFGLLFDVENPQITPGEYYNVYARGAQRQKLRPEGGNHGLRSETG